MSRELLDKGYSPEAVEKKWYGFWEQEKLFHADESPSRPSYSIVIPPPNVTGVLHMGHALNNTLQDILCRYHRLKGDSVLWMPGTDHAGIATQNVVEKKLAAEGTDRHHLGREKFIDAVWAWRQQSGSAIINQLKRLGASCDWDRERFTMDEGLSRAVRKVFVQLYNEGLIYQGDYIINWCCRCRTALSDLEVEHEEIDGAFYHIRYPLSDGSGYLTVATTRPETMLGDTAVALHPDDERYTHVAASATMTLPLMDREIPVIRDAYVDLSTGTGALKVTPAHDPNDFEMGIRHHLPSIKVMDDDGMMTEAAGRFCGMDRFACRKAVVEALKDQGLLAQVTPHRHSVGHCYRCHTIVEPNLSLQWFVKTRPLAEKAIKAVETGKTRIIPESWTKTYYDWMHNIRDWCISRQIWWGHQIPAWTCAACGRMVVAMDTPDVCPDCKSADLSQETDVLDTWFSSALWPFSTMGWPDQTPLLKAYYPTSVLVTAFDILFFWVARMMMMGIHFMDEIPFRDVYIHALVRDEEGKKMSKSLGNVIDPLNIIDQYGTDAFRFTLAAFAAQGRDVKMSEKRVEGYRHFINKLWNAARFALMHLDEKHADTLDQQNEKPLSLPDRWILSRLTQVAQQTEAAIDAYKFNEAAGAVYQFVWHELCDWYLEAIKPVLYNDAAGDEKAVTLSVLWQVFKNALVLLHPFAPFVTEEIWHALPGTKGSIMRANWPENLIPGEDLAAEADMKTVMAAITGIRNVRGEMNISPALALSVVAHPEDPQTQAVITANQALIMNLARVSDLAVDTAAQRPKAAATVLIEGAALFVKLEGIIDFSQEAARLEKEMGKLVKEMTGMAKKLGNADFLEKAPADVVAGVREKHAAMVEKHDALEATLGRIRAMME
ncbi:valine--tRNA ligase [Desulfosarcina sp. OttesenSCG-928-G10]|nr:valine--tRNA ligase [Desulfosarcina sp. OttesenSCG-928-G10]MDL2320856.1 valine--tRNA ligase [Desulfosarcina sp. OttesenSCG-928-B08]